MHLREGAWSGHGRLKGRLVDVEVILLVTAPNLRVRGDTHFLLLVEEGQPPRLPSTIVPEGKVCADVAAGLLLEHTGLAALINGKGWIPLKQVGVFDKPEQRTVAIGYGCVIPETTILADPKATWLTVAQLHEVLPLADYHMKILSFITMNL
jgi:hypothetical protein